MVSGDAARGGLAPWRVRRVLDHIDRNLTGRIAVSDLAKVVRLSPGHFSRACKKTLGDTPTAVIVSRRLQQAERLMLTSGEPLNQIALKCGFADQAHFGNRFRRHLGVSPSAWRRIHRSG